MARLHMVRQRMVSRLPIWVLGHMVKRLEWAVVVEEGSGVVQQLAASLATCLAHRRPVSTIISHITILLMVGARQGLDLGQDQIGVRQDGVAAIKHLAVEAAALAQGLPQVIKHETFCYETMFFRYTRLVLRYCV